ncbi:hypothetical protein SDC9_206415 [bioreactor metagenome]|uniref:Uncharacterized protein n=1 Tax=bioreactor metagenome TaxID=1076179 RepID=A0A645JE75_9ZZZZ
MVILEVEHQVKQHQGVDADFLKHGFGRDLFQRRTSLLVDEVADEGQRVHKIFP